MRHEPVNLPNVPLPRGHYSPGYRVGDLLFVSGQLPIEPGNQADATLPFDAQVRLALQNVIRVIATAGGTLTDIAKVNVYVTDVALWSEFNRIYADVFGDHRPARAVVPVPALNYGMKIEIEAVAGLRV
jgi:2-iminobutanoate/2-iminopropanoate deaminase